MAHPIARSSTMSLDPTLYHFIEENGRTYHKYKQGSMFPCKSILSVLYHITNDRTYLGYFLPNDSVRLRIDILFSSLKANAHPRQNKNDSVRPLLLVALREHC